MDQKELDNIVDKNHLHQYGIENDKYIGSYNTEFSQAWEYADNFYFLEAFNKFKELAKKRDRDSQVNLATMYESNPSFIDTDKAILWFRKAIEQESIVAEGALGELYRKAENYDKALPFLISASSKKDSTACNALSIMYWAGQGVSEDTNQAIKLMECSAQASLNNYLPYSNLAGYYLEMGNIEKAREACEKAYEIDPSRTASSALTEFEGNMVSRTESGISDYLYGGYSAESSEQTLLFSKRASFWKDFSKKKFPREVEKIEQDLAMYQWQREGELEGQMKQNRNKNISSCFVATEVYQNIDAPEVNTLRKFRNDILYKYKAGEKFISFYYLHSPKVANFISHHPYLRFPIRVLALNPLTYMIKKILKILA